MATSEVLMDNHPQSPQTSNENCDCVPQQLIEAQELLKVLNYKLEDCALERQAAISRDQWKIVHSKTPEENTANHCLLARTYFTNKDQDRAFQHLLCCNKIFSECVANFIALLRGEDPTLLAKQTRDVHSQWINVRVDDDLPKDYHPSVETKNHENPVPSALSLRYTFADLVKAKVNFDTKFLGFEAVLHNAASGTASTDECVCRFVADVARSKKPRRSKLKATSSSRKNSKKTKRLARSPRTLTKSNRRRKLDLIKKIPAEIIGDHA